MSHTPLAGNHHNGHVPAGAPDPEVVVKAQRRHFTAEYKQRILQEADACTRLGEVGALLRREGLYSSHLSTWRRQRQQGELHGLTPAKRGRKADPQAAAEAAPTIVDPVQQTLVTLLQGHLNSPLVKRSEVRKLIAELRRPANTTQVKRLKEVFSAFAANQQVGELIESLKQVLDVTHQPEEQPAAAMPTLTRDDLRLICFDHVV